MASVVTFVAPGSWLGGTYVLHSKVPCERSFSAAVGIVSKNIVRCVGNRLSVNGLYQRRFKLRRAGNVSSLSLLFIGYRWRFPSG